MPICIRVTISEKRSTHSQYENATIGADIEAQNLELVTAEDIARKTRELFQIARGAVQGQLLEQADVTRPAPSDNGRPENGNGNDNGNGRRRTYGRPSPQPSQKQLVLLRRLCGEKGLDASAVGDLADRLIGVPLKSCTMADVSRLIDCLLEEQAS